MLNSCKLLLLCALSTLTGTASAQATYLGTVLSTTNRHDEYLGTDLAFNASGTLAEADGQNVYRTFPGGQRTRVYGGAYNAVAIDNANNVYVNKATNLYQIHPDNTISVIDLSPSGLGVTLAAYCQGIDDIDPLYHCDSNYPADYLTTDPSGNVYLAFAELNEIIEAPTNGTPPFTLLSGLNFVTSITTDSAGNLYILDPDDNQILVQQPNGNQYSISPPGLLLQGLPDPNFPGSDFFFGQAASIAVDSHGAVYVGGYVGGQWTARIAPDLQNFTMLPTTGGSRYLAVDPGDKLWLVNGNNGLIEFDPYGIDFGQLPVGTASATAQTYFAIPPGAKAGPITAFTGGYAIGGNNHVKQPYESIGTTCAPGPTSQWDSNPSPEVCTAQVTFTPQVPGVADGQLTAVYEDLSTGAFSFAASVPMQGTGLGGQVAFQPPTPVTTIIPLSSSLTAKPSQIASDGAGVLYVAVPAENEVLAILPNGTVSPVSTAPYTLSKPQGVAVDGQGDLFIADTGNSRIVEVAFETASAISDDYYASLSTVSVLQTAGITLLSPGELTLDSHGNLYIANTGSNEIDEVTPYGTTRILAGNLSDLTSLLSDASGNLYFLSQSGLQELAASTSTPTPVPGGSNLSQPLDLAIDASGSLLVADYDLGVVTINPTGAPNNVGSSTSGSSTNLPLNFYAAQSIALTKGKVVVGGPGTPPGSTGTVLFSYDRTAVPNLTFQNTTKGQVSVDSPQTLAILNVGNQPFGYEISFPPDFPGGTLTSSDCFTSVYLLAANHCLVPVNFKPTTTGNLAESITMLFNPGTETSYTQTIPVSGSANDGNLPQTISFGGRGSPPFSYNYAAAPYLLKGTSTSGLPLTVTVLSGPADFGGAPTASVNGSAEMHVQGAGTVVLLATQAGNATYAPAASVQITVTINPSPIYPYISSVTQVYGSSQPQFVDFGLGLVNPTDQVQLVVTGGATAASPVGNYHVTLGLSGPAAASYVLETKTATLQVTPAPLSIGVAPASKLYGAALPAFSPTFTGLVNGDQVTTSFSTTATTASPVASYPVTPTATGSALQNYTPTLTPGTLLVRPAPLTVAANNISIPYGTSPPSFTATITGLLNGDLAAQAYSGQPSLTTQATAASQPGVYAIVGKLGTLTSSNYLFTFADGLLTIQQTIPLVFLAGDGSVASTATSGAANSNAVAGGGTGAAVDSSGYLWSIGSGGGSLSRFNLAGSLVQSYTGLGLNGASSFAIDGNSNLWITNGNGTLAAVSNAGSLLLTAGQAGTAPASGISVDISGNLWIANGTANTVAEILGAAAPAQPIASAVLNDDPGTEP